jgi:hypothetical protein
MVHITSVKDVLTRGCFVHLRAILHNGQMNLYANLVHITSGKEVLTCGCFVHLGAILHNSQNELIIFVSFDRV